MNPTLDLAIAGIGTFTPGCADWPALRAWLRGEHTEPDVSITRPAASVLPATERRRAPDGVRLAVEVAAQACRMAQCDPATLPSCFASTHGEVAISDHVCATLARAPLELSPTQFHNSVLNAAAGYWTIATGCTAASSAVSAAACTFAAALLEAATFACAEDTPVLFAACDTAAAGPLIDTLQTRIPFGIALVLGPRLAGTRVRLHVRPDGATPAVPPLPSALLSIAKDNPTAAQALPVLAALAANPPPTPITLQLSSGLHLHMEFVQ